MRPHLNRNRNDGGLYFATPHKDVDFIPTGSRLLDLALGGGWAQRRIANVVGDKAVGKTLIAIEAMANFSRMSDGSRDIGYRESEHSFLPDYARELGCPLERLDNWDAERNRLDHPLTTVEDLFDDLSDVIARQRRLDGRNPPPFLHIVDSLDALSDEEELARDLRKGSYGTKKARNMSELFRRLVGPLEEANITMLIISQVRSKIGPHLGRDTTRTGGRALDFYASQAVYLADIGKEKRTIRGQDRVVGVNVLAKVDKNKISNSYRAVEFPILFGYGIDDIRSCLDWLREIDALVDFGLGKDKKDVTKYLVKFDGFSPAERRREAAAIHVLVDRHWFAIERALVPKRRKYE